MRAAGGAASTMKHARTLAAAAARGDDRWNARVPRNREELLVVIAADYPFMDVFWSMLVFFFWVVWIWILITVLSDLFRRSDLSGWGKAAWMLFVIVLPYLGVFIYLITQGRQMAERRAEDMEASRAALDDHIRSVATPSASAPAEQIATAKQLLDTGTIDQAEFDQIKRRALAA
jgi:hypothetical protein